MKVTALVSLSKQSSNEKQTVMPAGERGSLRLFDNRPLILSAPFCHKIHRLMSPHSTQVIPLTSTLFEALHWG